MSEPAAVQPPAEKPEVPAEKPAEKPAAVVPAAVPAVVSAPATITVNIPSIAIPEIPKVELPELSISLYYLGIAIVFLSHLAMLINPNVMSGKGAIVNHAIFNIIAAFLIAYCFVTKNFLEPCSK